MSYILEALKKSEKKRQVGSVPDLQTVYDDVAFGTKRRSLWHYLFVATLLLNAGILVWWLVPWYSEKSNVVQSTDRQHIETTSIKSAQDFSEAKLPVEAALPPRLTKTVRPEATTDKERFENKPKNSLTTPNEDPVQVTDKKLPVQAKADEMQKVPSKPVPNYSNELSSGYTAGSPEIPSSEQEQVPIIKRIPIESETSADSEITSEKRVLNVDELPMSIRQSLPDFSISAHLYSKSPTSRMVRINDRMFREGQDLSSGLKLEQITSDGVILSYEDYRFSVRLY